MASYRTTITTPHPRDTVFAYLADFSSAAEWDPGVHSARALGEPGRMGSEFEVVARFLGRDVRLTYRTLAVQPPRRIALQAKSPTVVSYDEITVAGGPDDDTTVTYTADLRLRGALRVFDPLLGLVFKRIGDRARDGLAARLARPLERSAGAA